MVDLKTLRPGQKVRIVKPDSFKDNDYLSWVPVGMDSYDGRIVTVKAIIPEFGAAVSIEESASYAWQPDWLECCFLEDDLSTVGGIADPPSLNSAGAIWSWESIGLSNKWYDYELDYLDSPSPDVIPCENYDAAIQEFLGGGLG